MRLRSVALAAAVLAALPTPAEEEVVPPAEDAPADPAPWERPEPPAAASAADQALWRSGVQLSERITLEMERAKRAQWRAWKGRHEARLQERAARPDPAAAELLARFTPALAENWVTVTRPWPVDPTRGCRYKILSFQGVLLSAESRRRATRLAMVREELEDCVERGQRALDVLAASNERLEKALLEAEALLGAEPAPRPAPPAAGPAKP